MKRILIILILFIFGAQVVFTQEANVDVPERIRNNRFFRESLRLTNLARLAFEEGDYDASNSYSEEALFNARLSDEFVTDDAIAAAGRRLNYAASINAASRYPAEFSRAQTAYDEAHSFRAEESWNDAIDAAYRVFAALDGVIPAGLAPRAVTAEAAPIEARAATGTAPLPAQYTVRTWSNHRDCLWNIAGSSWAYNDPYKWRILYDANRAKMPKSDDPDLIEPGMVLDIPSIRGETRQGMWDAGAVYSPLP